MATYAFSAVNSIESIRSLLAAYYATHPYSANLPFITMAVVIPGTSNFEWSTLTFNRQQTNVLLGNEGGDPLEPINEHFNALMKLNHNYWNPQVSGLTLIPEFTYGGFGDPIIVSSDRLFEIDNSFVPFSDPDYVNSDISPNLGYMLGIDTSAISQTMFGGTHQSFPPKQLQISLKDPGEVRITITDNDRIIDADAIALSLPPDAAGNYNPTTGVLTTCLHRPLPLEAS